jgi:hypothetical protein
MLLDPLPNFIEVGQTAEILRQMICHFAYLLCFFWSPLLQILDYSYGLSINHVRFA